MQESKKNQGYSLSLSICLLGSLLAVLKMVTGSNLFLLLFLFLLTMGITIDRIENKILYILYFVPWAYAIKFNFSQPSLITVLSAFYCMICFIYIFINKTKVSIYYISVVMGVFIYSFLSIIISSSASITGVLSLLLNFAVIYFAALFVINREQIPIYVIFHALGLVVSGGVNFLGSLLPAIEDYIMSYTVYYTVNTAQILYTRFTGLDMDPNYFSIQVLIAVTCLGIIIFSSKLQLSKIQKIAAYVLITLLSVMGILTLSKMFLISFSAFILIYLVMMLKENFKRAMYYILSITSGLGIAIYIFYDYFYQAFFFRFFSEGTTTGSITTGRNEIWMNYYYEITDSARLMFIGNGISNQFLNNQISHNMYLIAWYYLGIFGIVIFFSSFIALYHQLKANLHVTKQFSILSITIVPLLIAVLANFALDSFVMDYFGVHVFLIILILVLDENDFSSKSLVVNQSADIN